MGVITETMLRSMLVKGIPNPYPITPHQVITPAAADFLRYRGIKIVETQEKRTYASIPVGVSNRHVHLTTLHIDQLFGQGHSLTPLRELSQVGQFAATETVNLIGPKGQIQRVRVLGPARSHSQVEITKTDGYQLGVHPLIRLSGDIEHTPGIKLVGPAGAVTLDHGVIIAKCHVHMSPVEAAQYGVLNGDVIGLRTHKLHTRSILYSNVIVRVNERFTLDFHIDMDEANAGDLVTGDLVEWV